MKHLSFREAVKLIKKEPTRAEMLEVIAILAESKQITPEMEIELQDFV